MAAGMTALQISGALTSSYSQYQMGKARKTISETNERIAEMRAKMARKRGGAAEARSRQRLKKIIGKQRAALAAQGISLEGGSAQDIQREARVVSELDALTIKTNAAREAFGFESAARAASMEGRLAEQQAKIGAATTLITGGMRAAEAYQGSSSW